MYLSIRDLQFAYHNSDYVIDGISFDVKKGEIVAIIGESGSGKSTLLRILAGLEVPQKGTILLDGKVLNSDHFFVKTEHRKIGMVFQNYALFPHMNVKDNILFGMKDIVKKERMERLEEMLSLVHLSHKKNAYPHELSGGQQQRIALARSLARKPKLLLLDEPFSNIDASKKQIIRKELFRIMQNSGITCILVTHDLTDAKEMAHRIIEFKG
jgi:iron(III) transport system ATP-binding protein